MGGSHSGIGMTSQRTRRRLIQRLQDKGIRDLSVLKAISEVPRHIFVDEALASRAYEETALPIGFGQFISQPYIIARMTELLFGGKPLNRVLEVGSGSGYQTAILACLAKEVYSIERVEALFKQLRYRFQELRLRNIRLKHGDGWQGWPEYAPYDGILVAAAAGDVPRALMEQLAPGGRMVIPIGNGDDQLLTLIQRTLEGYEREVLEPVSFVPLLPEQSK
jgi:protein-L-isoaspartate(D-aspartate) O-methyltransferase